jgi:glycosyltransferase involved in cell wall biosynthesis
LREYKEFQTLYPFLEQIFQVMRKTDVMYAQEPDLYIANSSTVAQRIRQIYGKAAVTINYPIDTNQFSFSADKENFYLVAARLLSYKRVDVIIEAFNRLGWNLMVLGDGPERKRLEARAGKNITFLGHLNDLLRRLLLSKAQSIVVAALEDYGLVPIEANASGTPVIAYGAGGVLDTQVSGKTGLFFTEQTPESLVAALLQAQEIQWDYARIRDHAVNRFSEAVFFEQIEQVVQNLCTQSKPISVDRLSVPSPIQSCRSVKDEDSHLHAV